MPWSFDLPPALRGAVDARLCELPRSELARAGAALSARYRSPAVRGSPTARTRAQVLAYVATRLPATYAAARAACAEVRRLRPEWSPRSLLDLGAGPGGGLWAAAAVWPGLERATALDAEPAMLALGPELARAAEHPAVAAAAWVRGDLAGPLPEGRWDLVLLSYALTEIDPSAIEGVIERAWSAAAGMLTVVEPGTPAGYGRVLRARAQVVRLGGRVAAPCPHDGACPLADGDWCHFAVRLARSRTHRVLKGGMLGHEDEKFAYVALSRGPTARAAARVVRHPVVRPGRVELRLCTGEGVVDSAVTRRDAAGFRRARKVGWGEDL